jgi:hypothetical protein
VVNGLSNEELASLVAEGHLDRGKAVFELADRARSDVDAATRLGALTRLPLLRDDRLFHHVSLARSTTVGLLATETEQARQIAYEAFEALDADDQRDLLDYLRCSRIQDAHPVV